MNSQEAKDVMLGIFKTAWDTTGFPARYEYVPGEKPPTQTVWARVNVRHYVGRQSSLSGEDGTRRYLERGTLTVQVFAPVGDGSKACYAAAQIVKNAFRDARHPTVWFTSVRMTEVGAEGAFEQINVLATFSYDDVR